MHRSFVIDFPQEWIDEFLTWEPTDFGNITKIRVPCQSIWIPDIVLYNKYSFHSLHAACKNIFLQHKSALITVSSQHGCPQCRRLYPRLYVQQSGDRTERQCIIIYFVYSANFSLIGVILHFVGLLAAANEITKHLRNRCHVFSIWWSNM